MFTSSGAHVWSPMMVLMPCVCACAVYYLQIAMTRLRSSSKGKSTSIHMGIAAGICACKSCEQVAVVCCGLWPSLCGALVLVATVATAMMAIRAIVIMPAVVAATQEVAFPRWGDAMVMCDGNKVSIFASDNASAGTTAEQFACTWGCAVGVNESVDPARPIKMSGGRGTSSAVDNAPVSPVSPDPLGPAGTVVKVDIDAREVGPLGIDTHG